MNDGTATDMAENTFVTVASGSGTLNKLEITAGSTGNANIYLGAVEVDGVILQDNNSKLIQIALLVHLTLTAVSNQQSKPTLRLASVLFRTQEQAQMQPLGMD